MPIFGGMEEEPDSERDTIAWFRISVIVASAVIGLYLLFSGHRAAACFVLGYALFGATMNTVFWSWRDSSEVTKVQRSLWRRMLGNTPRSLMRYFLALFAMIAVLFVGLVPLLVIPNDFQTQHEDAIENFVPIYGYVLSGASMAVYFWISGILNFRQTISDFKALRDAERRAKKRSAKEKENAPNH